MKKTKIKIMSLLLSMVLFLFVPFLNIQAASNHPARLVDQAELLTAEEQQQIQAKLDEVSELHHCDAVVMTVNSLEGKTATEYADDAFDYDGYGLGEDKAGILFLVDMGDRNWATSTHGYAITAFTDARLSYIEEKLVSYLGDGEYAEAFNCFAEQCDRFLTQAETGEPYDVDNMPETILPMHSGWLYAWQSVCDCTDHGIDQTFQTDFRCEADHSRRIYEKRQSESYRETGSLY